MTACKGFTKAGKRCRTPAGADSPWCWRHRAMGETIHAELEAKLEEDLNRLRRTPRLDYSDHGSPTVIGVQGFLDLGKCFGTEDPDAVEFLLTGLASASSERDTFSRSTGEIRQRDLQQLVAMVAALEPQTELEAMLAAQMVVCHSKALLTLSGTAQVWLDLGVKLSHLFAKQVETLRRLQQGTDQNINVRHQHEYKGPQRLEDHQRERQGEGGCSGIAGSTL